MKIACLDKSASDRLKLQQHFESAYEQCRTTLGHMTSAHILPLSKEETLLSTPPDVVAVGPGFPLEEAYNCCREIRETHPSAHILLFLGTETYSLRSLRRFEKAADDIFSPDEPPTRLVHILCRLQEGRNHQAGGKMLYVQGVKGGVGTTSVVSGLAHAAEALGKTAVVLDLSSSAALIHYMGAARWQSSDYATALADSLPVDPALVQRLLVTAPNGVHLLLPPAGGSEIRETWLRDVRRFECTLSIVEILKDMFDAVIVDGASSEGVLPFALAARSQTRLLVTSNDAASIHLLSRKLSEVHQMPGESPVYILGNLMLDNGLGKDDIIDFLYLNKNYNDEMTRLRPIGFDSSGKDWIGTGNTFYTESSRRTQLALELCLTKLLNPAFQFSAEALNIPARSLLGSLWKQCSAKLSAVRIPTTKAAAGAIPLFESGSAQNNPPQEKLEERKPLRPVRVGFSAPERLAAASEPASFAGHVRSSAVLYEPPKLVDPNLAEGIR
jgi:MinD-like ATPase involved in chromosome partitioning or flagellar assembly